MGDSRNQNLSVLFQAYLKKNRLRETYERKVVADAISRCSGHFDIEMVESDISASGDVVSRATIYNTLKLLSKANLVRRQQFADGQFLYESAMHLPAGNQLYLICNECGKIANMRSSSVTRELNGMKFGSFTPEYISMTVYGTCSRCTRKLKREANATNRSIHK